MDYTNYLGENAVIVFIISDAQGNTLTSQAYTAPTGSVTAQVNYFCVNGGSYYMSWEAYSESDSDLLYPVDFSNPDESELMAC